MISIDIQKGVIVIQSPFEDKDQIKTLSQRQWNPEMRCWTVPLSVLHELLLKFPDAELSGSILEEIEKIQKLRAASNAVSSSLNLNINGNVLMPFQNAGVEFLEVAKGKALIADEMGLGKTIQAIAYLYRHPEMKPAIIICPASLKINWQREIKKWMNVTATIVNGKKMEAGKQIYIINYDILKNHKDSILQMHPQIMILDESHYVKNYKTMRTKNVIELASQIPHKILLTGTPVLNRPNELWQQLNIIDSKIYNNFFTYAIKYCNATKERYGWDFSGSSNTQELNDQLKTIMIRRTKTQVLPELPDKRKQTIEIAIDNRSEYETAKNHFLSYIRGIKGNVAAENASKAAILTQMETLKQVAVRGKITQIQDWIDSFLETGEKLIVFATHRNVIETLYKQYYNIAVTLTGDSSMIERQSAIDSFQNNSNIKLFIGNIKAAGVGITLTASSNVAFIELPWTPSELSQAEDRTHRIGQKSAVNVYYLISSGTIEEIMAELLKKKSEVINAIVDGKESSDINILDEIINELLVIPI